MTRAHRSLLVFLALAFAGRALEAPAARPELLTPQAETAIERGVAYLARSQNADGSFGIKYRGAVTALAGLALLANGNTPASGTYAANVERCADFLLRCAGPTGLICVQGEESRAMYAHGFSMLFLAQVYGMETSPTRLRDMRRVLRRAVELTVRSQSRLGGWYYAPNNENQEGSNTAAQIQGLRACREAGIFVPPQTIERACDFLARCAMPDGSIAYGIPQGSQGKGLPAITAAAVATLYSSGRFDNPLALAALRFSREHLRANNMNLATAYGSFYAYALFYIGQALWFSGDADWKEFFPPIRDQLLSTQLDDGAWKDMYGNEFGAAIALVILQLPYQYVPIFQR